MSDEENGGSALAPITHEPEIIDRQAAGSVRVLTLPSPFSFAREEQLVPEGRTLAEILAGLDLPDWQSAMVALDGIPVEAQWWSAVRPKSDHLVTVRAIPRGGGGSSGNKGWIQIAAGVVLIILGIVLSPYTAGFSLYAVPLGVGLILSGAITLIFPPPSLPRLKSGSGADAPVFSITGSRNVANPYGAVPRVYGRHRIYPPEGA